MSIHPLENIFHPQSIAIIGASSTTWGMGSFLASLIEHKFNGKIYPVNPRYSDILGLKSYPSIKDIPESFDYAIFAIPASEVLQSLEECSKKGVKIIHLYTARFSESGRSDAVDLEHAILRRAKELDIRLIGPNCMGIYYPQKGVSWELDFPKEPGAVGLISQSGALATEIIRTSGKMGIRFSKAISFGNAIDLNESDFLEYLAHDSETKIIMMYLEGVKDGRRFFKNLRRTVSSKPVIILKGGRSKAGARATVSHTASLAGTMQIWNTAVTQIGAIPVNNLDELIDLTLSFCFLPPIRGRKVGVVAGAGGASVLAADICEEAGLDAISLPEEIREELKENGVLVWDWINNPVDFSIIYGPNFRPNDLLNMMAANPNFDLLITSLGGRRMGPGQGEFSIERYLQPYKLISSTMKPLIALVPDWRPGVDELDDERWNMVSEIAENLVAAKIPFYPTIDRAAKTAGKLINYYQNRG
ncbi:CoA-binding protein [Chloroflexota bacterium]